MVEYVQVTFAELADKWPLLKFERWAAFFHTIFRPLVATFLYLPV